MGSMGEYFLAEDDTVAVDINISAAHDQHGLAMDSVLRTVWAITNHVYTGDDEIEILEYVAKVDSVSKVSTTSQVDSAMSGLQVAASQQAIKGSDFGAQKTDDSSSEISLRHLVKRTAIFLTRVEDIQLVLQNHAEMIDQTQNLLCAVIVGEQCRVFLHRPAGLGAEGANVYLADTIKQVAHSIFPDWNSAIGSLHFLGPANRDRILQTTGASVMEADASLADIVTQQATARRDRLAIDAWDGRFTYNELYRSALRLAAILQSNDISIEERIPLCMKKSKWTVAAMFGIFLAGGTCVPLDINSPPKRLLALTERLKARFVVTDQTMFTVFTKRSLSVVTYPGTLTDASEPRLPLPRISPSAAAFVYFTSGSTGTPKGVVLEHGSLYAAIREVSKGYGLNEQARVFQYAAYVFDVSMGDIFGALMNGGCLCIPSEEARMDDPAASMNTFAVTHACLTNTVATYIQPSRVPTLQRLFIGGEALDKAQVPRWSPHVDFNVVYGTTESLIWDSLAGAKDLLLDHNNLGRPIGPCLWVSDVNAPDQIRPLGAIGEILIEGPLLARGYMDDPTTTASRFIPAPAWMRQLRQDPQLRCYRTGDLGSRNADGTVSFVGRADTQVKIRGQRVELGEIEHNILMIDPTLEHVAVDATTLPSRSNIKTLAAFIYHGGHGKDSTADVLSMDESHREDFRRIRSALTNWLPQHMVPALYFPIGRVPRAVTGKLDRITLKRWASDMSAEQLSPYYLEDEAAATSRAPETVEEKIVQQAWARTMEVAYASVGVEDHFFQSGGNSIKAMELAGAIRDLGRSLSVAAIFQNPRLSAMAIALGDAPGTTTEGAILPFGLIAGRVDIDWCVQEAARACTIDKGLVEDVYPTTPMQEALLATSANRASIYNCQLVFTIPESVDLTRFKSAWENLVAAQQIFRTRICVVPGVGSVQVVTRPNITWSTGKSRRSLLDYTRQNPMTYGTELNRYAIVHDEGDGHKYFIWSGHHAIYDAWSQALMLREIYQCYQVGTITPQVPYRRFIQYLDTLDAEKATEFWKAQFTDVAETFPKLPAANYTPQPDRTMTLDLKLAPEVESKITTATLIQAAWALVVARHMGSDDAVFGLTLSGRDAPVSGITSMLGPTITTVPLRINLDNTMTITQYLQDVQALVTQVRLYQHTGLQTIRRLGPEASSAVDFQTLLVIHPSDFEQDRTLSELGLELFDVEETDTRDLALTVQCILDANTVRVRAQFDEAVVDSRQLESLLYTLEHVLSQMTEASADRTLYDLDMMSHYDLDRLAEWNSIPPQAVSACIHTLVEERVLATPHAQAISGFDRDYTYSELDVMASRLAGHLSRMGVRQESRVALCFTKSSWPIIAMLAVLKSGGACVSMDPDHPLPRLQEIIRDIEAEVLLCDEQAVEKFKSHVAHVAAVNTSFMTKLVTESAPPSTSVLPSNASFVVYTSGSTGKPKGSILEHRALCTSLRGIAQKSGMNSRSRTLQFSAYTFDAHILEIFGTLIAGGCVCVISNDQRMNRLAETIDKCQVNWSLLTPTVARLLWPEEVPTMETLILSGEPLAKVDVLQWAHRLRLLNGLGPSECSILACLTDTLTSQSVPANIGHALGCHLWITDPRRPGRLLPLGATGELTIEGPIVGREYLKRPKATAAAFISNPAWSHGTADNPRRFYRTSDLAKFNMDGSVTFIGRADSQVKIRGQRVELGEIEHNLKDCGPNVAAVVVDIVNVASRADTQNLVAFVVCHGADQELYHGGPLVVMSSDLKDDFLKIQETLTAKLPKYMVPSLFLPVRDLPVSTSGKLERKKLRTRAASLSADDLALYYLKHSVGPSEATTEKEKQLLRLWSQVLKIPEKTIGIGDNFFQLGGDSVTAMQLIAATRAANLSLTVADVFQSPQLVDMARQLGDSIDEEDALSHTEPFDLIRNRVDDLAAYVKDAGQECQVEPQLIEDIYPCTPIQEALMAVSTHQPRAYTHRSVFRLPRTLDLGRFRAAWEAFVSRHAIFRTRIVVQRDLGAVQVVLNQNISWRTGSSLNDYLEQDHQQPIEYGGDLSRFALVPHCDGTVFIWTVHHATYDGWSLARVFEEVCRHLKGDAATEVVPYRDFVRYVSNVDKDKSDEFWRGQFSDLVESFPHLPSSHYAPKPRQRKTAVMQTGRQGQAQTKNPVSMSTTTMATTALAAWVLVTAPYVDGEQAHFGLALSGRDVAVTGITEVMGPTITTVPMRVRLLPNETVSGFLQRIQTHVTEVRKHQHTGMQRIRRLNPQARAATHFQNLVVVQTMGDAEIEAPFNASGISALEQPEDEFLDLALATECIIRSNTVQVNIQYDDQVVADGQVEFLLKQMEHVLSVLLFSEAPETTLLRETNLVSPFDREQIDSWHGPMPDAVEATVHGLFETQVSTRPHDTALSGFDGEHTYLELEEMANTLACQLVELGVSIEAQVVLCFNKSSSAIVAMLAVLKSGGACISVNPQHPTSRLLDICHDSAPPVILCDQQYVSRFEGAAPHVLMVDISLPTQRSTTGTSWTSQSVPSDSAAFTVYTSGTTGTPKGVVLEHRSLCTSFKLNGRVTGMSSQTRALQFSAYTFDVHIFEIFCTLAHGGCVCVISEEERMGSLAETINAREVNWASLTPTVARSLPEDSMPGFQTLVLLGEPVTRTDIHQWTDHVLLSSVYGPAECSIAVCSNDTLRDIDPSDMGQESSCHIWITDRENPDRLMPVGAVGEMLIEGTVVGRGYLNRPDETAKAFITDPLWSRNGAGPRRFYRTGDLARLSHDGRLKFMGRVDTQVKIRGQRVELGEVEHQARARLPSSSEVIVELVQPKGAVTGATLASFVYMDELVSTGTTTPIPSLTPGEKETFQGVVAELQRSLTESLPEYMVPAAYIPISTIPTLPSGKTDRASLRKEASCLAHDEMYLRGAASERRQPSTDIERELQAVWSRILNFPVADIGVEDTFTSLGGDSITAMQAVAECRRLGIKISTSAILGKKTIAAIGPACLRKTTPGSHTTPMPSGRTYFSLSPTQRFYFARQGQRATQLSQSFLLRVRQGLSIDQVQVACNMLVERHDMLRARFERTVDDDWQQSTTPMASDSYRFVSHVIGHLDEIEPRTRKSSRNLNGVTGPVFSADIFGVGSEASAIFLVAHPLVIDSTSWRIILRDLGDLLRGNRLRALQAPSFRQWCELQEPQCLAEGPSRRRMSSSVQASNSTLWQVPESDNVQGAVITESFQLRGDTASLLLDKSNATFRTQPLDIFLGTLILSFRQTFVERDAPTVLIEQHVRGPWQDKTHHEVDSSNAVGRFTTISPVYVPLVPTTTTAEAIRSVKDTRHTGSGSERAQHFNDHDSAEILVTFSESLRRLEDEDGLLEIESRMQLQDSESASDTVRSALIDVDVEVCHRSLIFTFRLHRQMAGLSRLRKWIQTYQDALSTTAHQLIQQVPSCSLSDFPLLDLTYAELDDMFISKIPSVAMNGASSVRDIYPCTAMQEGILLSQQRDGQLYKIMCVWEFRDSGLVNDGFPDRVKAAWQSLVQKHSSLRTDIVQVAGGHGNFLQVVLDNSTANFTMVEQKVSGAAEVAGLLSSNGNSAWSHLPHLSLYLTSDGRAACRLELSHVVVDGTSVDLLISEFVDQFMGRTSAEAPMEFARFVEYERGRNSAEDTAFWTAYLRGAEACQLPTWKQVEPPAIGYGTFQASRAVTADIAAFCRRNEVTPAALLQTAWAIVLGTFTGLEDVCLGYFASDRDAPFEGIESSIGLFISTQICRVRLTGTMYEVLNRVQQDILAGLEHRNCSLATIHNALGLNAAPLFNTCLTIRRGQSLGERDKVAQLIDLLELPDQTEYAVVLHGTITPSEVTCDLTYRQSDIPSDYAQSIGGALETVIKSLTTEEDQAVSAINRLGLTDTATLEEWTSQKPSTVPATVHGMVEQQVRDRSDAPATSGFDGNYTYAQINQLATKLAAHLTKLEVTVETRVVLCFSKSTWPAVAMLAILKAGGVCVSVNPRHPRHQVLEILEDVGANVVLCDTTNAALFAGLAIHIVAVDHESLSQMEFCDSWRQPVVGPNNAAFVVYTSGTTGRPKGSILEHQCLCTSMTATAERTRMDAYTRALQFSAYTFDAHILEIFGTWIVGGCVCIPSERERMESLAEVIHTREANWSLLTPTVARMISPKKVPTLRTLILAGEPLIKQDIWTWAGQVQAFNGIGPSECSVLACMADLTLDSEPSNIGYPLGCHLWITNHTNPDQLLPIGCVGEILIEGPIVGRGYINRPEATATAFITDPAWCRSRVCGESQTPRRFYRSGDLGGFNTDGSITFFGRRDTQVKIHGQRVELGEIEHHIKAAHPGLHQVAVELCSLSCQGGSQILTAFVEDNEHEQYASSSNEQVDLLSINDETKQDLAEIRQTLRRLLPLYKVPTLFVPVRRMPCLATGKVDRKAMRQRLAGLTLDQFAVYALSGVIPTRPPTTAAEQLLQQVWAKVLCIPAACVGAEDHFFQSGGDSARAMQLIARLREMRYTLSVAQIFRTPQLSDLAAALEEVRTTTTDSILRPFTLIRECANVDNCIRDVAQICQVDVSAVEDLYPTTPMQEALVAVSTYRRGAYYHQMLLKLPGTLELARFKDAWQTLAAVQAILRTRIVHLPGVGTLQAVLRSPITWRSGSSLQQCCQEDRQVLASNGAELSRFAIVTESDENLTFVWTVHHALYDGWSLSRIFEQVESIYQGRALRPVVPYGHFIRYLSTLDLNASDQFWREQFAETVASYPPLPSANYTPIPRQSRSSIIDISGRVAAKATVTTATLIQAGYALVMAQCANTSDALFGLALSGRDAPVPGIADITGPTLATVPILIRIDRSQSVAEFLRDVQRQVTAVQEHQHIGLQRIRSLGPNAKAATSMQNLLTIQNTSDSDALGPLQNLGLQVVQNEVQGFLDLALSVECVMRPDVIDIAVQYDSNVVPDVQVDSLLRQFKHTITALLDQSEQVLVRSLDLIPVEDLRQQQMWNHGIPKPVDATVHELVGRRAMEQPDAIAMSGFQGDWTYDRLNSLATTLAIYLTETLGCRPEARVVLCFAKSVWPSVAMLAVLKSGGVCVSVNPDHPRRRLLDICRDTETAIVLCDGAMAERFCGQVAHVFTVDSFSLAKLSPRQASTWVEPRVRPSHAAFIVYTSGSTGTPKGSVLEHQALCTSLTAIGARSDINTHSRTLQFSAYTFDAHILEIFGTLIHGGCVCVISDEERLSNLAGVIQQRKANWALLTPTVARLLAPQSIPDLKTLILSGEPAVQQDVEQWAGGHVRLFNGLGPSECSILVCLTRPLALGDSPSNIGFSMACNIWIVDHRYPDNLLPTGCVGEMVIEGPIIGREYINRAEATAAAFVHDLKWSQDGSGRSRRFYRTGDLAKFNSDGSVTYFGRADLQVKIRGQRVELGEIETEVRQCLPPGGEALVEYLPATDSLPEPTLVAFVRVSEAAAISRPQGPAEAPLMNGVEEQPEPVDDSKDWALQSSIPHSTVVELRQSLSDRLPKHMIPTGYVSIPFIPYTPSGKTDRGRIRRYAQSLTREDMHMRDVQVQKAEPTNDMERELCAVWSRILNCPANKVGVDESFTSLGGDSITAMQTVAECRKRGIRITVSTILDKKAIRKIAPMCTKKSITSQGLKRVNNHMSGTAFDLSPVQRLYLTKESPEWTQFNQSFLLRLRQQVSVGELRRALDAIVDRHSMLRARFTREDSTGNWQQRIAPVEIGCYRLEAHHIKDLAHEIEPCTQKSGASLDIVHGPVFSVDLFDIEAGDAMLFMAAHHLVIDLVSWRVIWRELEEILQGGTPSSVRSLSYQRWCELQEIHSRSQAARLDEVLPLPTPPSGYAFWQMDESRNTLGETVEESFRLDANSSGLILGRGNDPLRTSPLDILLGLLTLSFRRTFVEREMPSVFLEQHGREVWETDQDIDISETVGWFTAMYPLHVPLAPGTSAIEAIRLVKDLRRTVPDNGRPYFACRHLLPEGARRFQQHDPPEVLFNFAGSFQQLENPDRLLELESRLELHHPESGPRNHRWSMIDVNVTVSQGVMKFSFDLHKEMAHLGLVRQWIHQYQSLLLAMPAQLVEQQPTFTLSDFPLLKISYPELADVVASTGHADNIHDIFPLSYYQTMHVRGNLETPPRHLDYVFVDVPPIVGLTQLREACRKLVKQFDSLRTVFVSSGDQLLQVVLKTMGPRIDVGEYREDADVVVERLCQDDLLHSGPQSLGQSFLRFMIVRTPKQVRVIIRLSHAQYDGVSLSSITAAFASFCEGGAVPESHGMVEYVRHCRQQNPRGYDYWRSLLKGSELTVIPKIYRRASHAGVGTTRANRTVPHFNTIPGITSANIFASACAMLLASMKASSDVVFARFVSGRAGLDAGIQDVVGPCVNIVPVRARMTGDTHSLMSCIQRQHVESIAHETVGWDELASHCTEWSASDAARSPVPEIPVLVQFRNYSANLEASVAGSSLHVKGWDQTLVHPFPRTLCLGAFPAKDDVMVSVSAGSAFCTPTDIEHITDELCDILARITQQPN